MIDRGDLFVPMIEEVVRDHDYTSAESVRLRQDVIRDVTLRLSQCTYDAVMRDAFPLVLGGDHTIGCGTHTGIQAARRAQNKPPAGIIWFDAHADFNTMDTSPSGNLHGMPLAALHGLTVEGLPTMDHGLFTADRTALVCIRDVDDQEGKLLATNGLHVGQNIFTMAEIDTLGMFEVMKRAIAIASGRPTDWFNWGAQRSIHRALEDVEGHFVLSLDLDSIDPQYCPGTGTPVKGGASYREAHLAMEMVSRHGGLCGMDIVECNPILDVQNMTAVCAVDLAASALGKTIVNVK